MQIWKPFDSNGNYLKYSTPLQYLLASFSHQRHVRSVFKPRLGKSDKSIMCVSSPLFKARNIFCDLFRQIPKPSSSETFRAYGNTSESFYHYHCQSFAFLCSTNTRQGNIFSRDTAWVACFNLLSCKRDKMLENEVVEVFMQSRLHV